jgi:Zn-dependent membrane protease YugP
MFSFSVVSISCNIVLMFIPMYHTGTKAVLLGFIKFGSKVIFTLVAITLEAGLKSVQSKVNGRQFV